MRKVLSECTLLTRTLMPQTYGNFHSLLLVQWSNVDRVYRKWNCMFLLLDLYSMRLLPYTHLPLILTNPYYT